MSDASTQPKKKTFEGWMTKLEPEYVGGTCFYLYRERGKPWEKRHKVRITLELITPPGK